jgi:TfoX/Sxy family transcriptional regulator of competence genes
MVEFYLLALRSLLERAAPRLDSGVAIECRHFFGGAAAYANGHIFMTLTPAGLALKLSEESRTALIDRGATPLRYFPKAPIKKDYVVVPKPLAEDAGALAQWIEESIRLSRAPPKPRKAK